MGRTFFNVSGTTFLVCLVLSVSVPVISIHCEYYNDTMCSSLGVACNESEECEAGDNGRRSLCFVLLQNNSHGISVKLKGCWVESSDNCFDRSCRQSKKQLYFCCCDGDMCNRDLPNLSNNLLLATRSDTEPTVPTVEQAPEKQSWLPVLCIILSLVFLALVIVLAYYLVRRHRQVTFNQLPTCEPSPLSQSTRLQPAMLYPIQLVKVKAQGHFGAVWKARMLNDIVAVKVFSPQNRASWQSELEVFKLPQMQHQNLLYFYGAEKRGENLQAEYWLITAYHSKGSLGDYLKSNLLTWAEVLSIADSIAKGLTHLHSELKPRNGEALKPAIAHRDFKSKNVLLKSDMTACVADFGLALVFKGYSSGEDHGQVGTGRYMAPEVLEGAINFSMDAFLRIDMYACGLVLWELVSRCSYQDGPVEEYAVPFEDEVGQHPTLEDMQEAVAQKKLRPKIKETWRNNPGLLVLCDTIEECWDHDAEARLSSSCVQERVSLLQRTALHKSSSQLILAPGEQLFKVRDQELCDTVSGADS